MATTKECIFCGHNRLSKEHLWSKWTREKLGKTETVTHFEQEVSGTVKPSFNEKVDPDKKVGSGLHGVTVIAACRACNNGWMSELDALARPTLERLFDGNKGPIDTYDQSLLARFAVMKLMVLGYYNDEPVIHDFEERDLIRRKMPPSDNWSIWITNLERVRSQRLWSRNTLADNGQSHTDVYLLQMGQLAIVGAYTMIDQSFEYMAERSTMFRQIHPTSGRLSWPPLESAGPEQLSYLYHYARSEAGQFD